MNAPVPAPIPVAADVPAAYAPPRVIAPVGMFSSPDRFEHAQRVAKVFASSALVPKHFQNQIADCLIALNIADRMQEDPLTVMQNLAVVNGRPAWQTQYMIARANRAGVFKGPITWKSEGRGDGLVVKAMATLSATGEIVDAEVSMAMAQADGWTKNPKYRTMPEHMLRWRAAAFLVRLYAPEVMIGIPTAEEVEPEGVARDIPPPHRPPPASIGAPPAAPPQITREPVEEVEAEPVTDWAAEVARAEGDIAAAQRVEDVTEIADAFWAASDGQIGRDLAGRVERAVDAALERLKPKAEPQVRKPPAAPPAAPEPPRAQDDAFPGDLPLDPAEEGEETDQEFMARVFQEGVESARAGKPRNVIPRPFASDPEAKARFEAGWDSVKGGR